ncbi:regulatory protein RecX [Allokutzneria sp. NRRL B-24872]|uniref:regulatory protein RecX n=1 Tax=Allokutzneria sp. NRRL B-24872 TaxID=1137961 RepID=UPI001FEF51BC|nr:regulatory protein RecX [Allokutzneria sp. NRRL B-24872]
MTRPGRSRRRPGSGMPGGSGPSSADGASAERRQQAPRDPVEHARDICLRLLAVRPRTRVELEQALRRKEIPDDVIAAVLDRYSDLKLVDDAAFAELWVRSRHTHQGMARRALVAELRRKGVDGETAADAASTVDSEAEEERARALVRRKIPSVLRVDETARVRRLVGMLARKGYPEGMAYRVVRDELREAGSETTLLDD